MKKSLLVVSAHAADFVWRCGGTMAIYAQAGWSIHVVCISAGARSESWSLWRDAPGQTEERVAAMRFSESKVAAGILGASVEYLDLPDAPLTYSPDHIVRLARIMREHRPSIVLTHHTKDVLNPDHSEAFKITMLGIRAANVNGILPEIPIIDLPALYSFESDQCAMDEFNPTIYVNIDPVHDIKVKAMESVQSQAKELVQRYIDRAKFRASLGRTFGFGRVTHAEAFTQHFPLHCAMLPESNP
jgi:4-oxalomesaconate hydratase